MLAKSPKSYGRHINSDKIDFLTLLAILSSINYNNIILPPSCREGPFQALFIVMSGFIRVLDAALFVFF